MRSHLSSELSRSRKDARNSTQVPHPAIATGQCVFPGCPAQMMPIEYRLLVRHYSKHIQQTPVVERVLNAQDSYERRYKCPYCDKVDIAKRIAEHFCVEHLCKKPVCEGCGYSFRRFDALTSHRSESGACKACRRCRTTFGTTQMRWQHETQECSELIPSRNDSSHLA